MIFNEAALRIMCNYPVDILKAVTDPGAGLPAKLKWFPSLAELKEACEMLMEFRRQYEDKLKRRAEQLDARDEWLKPRTEPRKTAAEILRSFEEVGFSSEARRSVALPLARRNSRNGTALAALSSMPSEDPNADAAHRHWTATPVAILRRRFAAARSLSLRSARDYIGRSRPHSRDECSRSIRAGRSWRARWCHGCDIACRRYTSRARRADCQGRRTSCAADKVVAQPSRAADTSQATRPCARSISHRTR